MTETEAVHGDVIDPSVVNPNALEVLQRAEIDVQITTAKRYPRSIEQFKRRATEMASLDAETASSCIYRRPVGKENGRPVFAEGMSIRMAEIVAACYGNIRSASRIIEQTDRYVKCQGVCHDLETNNCSSSEVIESTVDKNGRPYSERMRVVLAKACLAKAHRDAIFKVVPRALARPIELAAREVIAGDKKSLGERRQLAEGWVNSLKIDPKRVFNALDVQGWADVTNDHLVELTGIRTAIKDGETSVDEAFPPLEDAAPPDTGMKPGAGSFREPKKQPAPKDDKPKSATPENSVRAEPPREEVRTPAPQAPKTEPAAPVADDQPEETREEVIASIVDEWMMRRADARITRDQAMTGLERILKFVHRVDIEKAAVDVLRSIRKDLESGVLDDRLKSYDRTI